MVQREEIRKGPWTEQEDVQLVLCVNVYGDRRWDFIAKVSGLKRTGKSCRLRWVNYLHPGLKRGKMSPHEERLVLELHSKWGNRWSRIARKLPGRTDNEIKNYWRTHMRKKAQLRKKATSHSPSSSSVSSSSSTELSNCSSSVSNGNSPTVESVPIAEIKERSFYDTGGFDAPAAPRPAPAAAASAAAAAVAKGNKAAAAVPAEEEKSQKVYSMDEIWKDMEFFGDEAINPVCDGGCCDFSRQIVVASPAWDFCPVSLWVMDDHEDGSKMFPNPPPVSDPFYYSFCNQQESAAITGLSF